MLYACDAMNINEFILLYILLKSGMLGFAMSQNCFKSKTPKSIIFLKQTAKKDPQKTNKIYNNKKTPNQ